MSQQPGEVYPYNPNAYPSTPAQPSSHSNGSFAPVLIVLAVILVVTIIAVVVGRCGYPKGGGKAANRKSSGKKKGKGGGGVAAGKLNNGKFQESDEGGDIEFGFGNKRISTSKVANGNLGPPPAGGPMMPQRSDPRGPRMMPMPMPMPNHQSGGGGGGGGGRGHHHVRFGDHNDVINPSQFHPGS